MPAATSVIVLGGKGFVGSAIAAAAAEQGLDLRVVDKDEYEGAVGAACDLLINANGNSKKFLGMQDPRLEFDLSVRSVLRSLHDFRAARYVFLSTIDVYPRVSDPADNAETAVIDPQRLSPYGFHKHLAEQLVRRYAPRWLIFRMAGFVGRGLWKNSIHDLLHGRPLRVHPDSAYQYLDTRDLARLVLHVAAQPVENEIFNIAGDGVITLREIAAGIPGCVLPPEAERLPRERYEVNLAKLKAWATPPPTRATVRRFLAEIRRDGTTAP